MRREYRVAGQAEPISHFTDAVEANGLLFVSGIVPVDERRELVGGDDVVAQARCVFENMRAVLARGGLHVRGRRQGDRLPHGRERPAARSTRCGRRCSAIRARPRRSSRSRRS